MSEGKEINGAEPKAAFLGLDTPFKWLLFLGYIGGWIGRQILMYASKTNGKIEYNYTSVVLLTALLKLVIAIGMYLRDDGSVSDMFAEIKTHAKLAALYMVPAYLYCVYDNLSFTNLDYFDPITYAVLSQLRLIITGVVYQALFNKTLNKEQWMALVLLFFGCAAKEVSKFDANHLAAVPVFGYFLLFTQLSSAVVAGVYNEYLLKGKGSDGEAKASVNLQNIFMYGNSIIGNVLIMSIGIGGRSLSSALQWNNLVPLLNPKVLIVLVLGAVMGMVTGFFLRYLDSMLKAIAGALILVGTAIMAFLIFGSDFGFYTIVSVVLVGYGVYLYSTAGIKKASSSTPPPPQGNKV